MHIRFSLRRLLVILVVLAVPLTICGYGYRTYRAWEDLWTEYDLDENTFTRAHLQELEQFSGISFPPGAKGMRLHYLPPIDPVYFAKIRIPRTSLPSLKKQLENSTQYSFDRSFANSHCKWWPANFIETLLSEQVFAEVYVELHVVEEDEDTVAYIKAFTI